MAAYLNYAALRTVRLRSDALGPVDSIGHPLEQGRYHGTVWRGDSVYGSFFIEIGADGSGDQVDIDLAAVARASEKDAAASFRTGPRDESPVFAVFHCDGDLDGFRAVLTAEGRRSVEFDTTALGPGDYYILTPLKPGRWNIRTNGGAKGSVTIDQAKPGVAPRASQSGVMIRTDGKTFDPADAHIVSGDGLVFEVTGAKVAIEVELEARKEDKGRRRPVGVRYLGRDGARAVAKTAK